MQGIERTHEPSIPRAEVPSRYKVLHDQDIGDDSLVVPKREASYGRKDRASQGIVVVQQAGYAWWAIRIRVGAVRMDVQDPSVRYLFVDGLVVPFYIVACNWNVSVTSSAGL